jgi:putative flippase GtrA
VNILFIGHENPARIFSSALRDTQGAHSWAAHHEAMLTLSRPVLASPPASDPDPNRPRRGTVSILGARRLTIFRLLRYAAVSLVATTTTMASLGIMVGLVGMSAVWSNVVATAIGTIPSFELNRRWVWGRSDRRSLLRQVVPFCSLAFAGLVLSTLAVGVVSGYTSGWTRMDHTSAVELANLAAYGSLWIVQYQLLNRLLFAGEAQPPFTADRQADHSSAATRTPMLAGTDQATTSTGMRYHDGK